MLVPVPSYPRRVAKAKGGEDGGRGDVIPRRRGSSRRFFIIRAIYHRQFDIYSPFAPSNHSASLRTRNMDQIADSVKNVYQSTPYQAAGAAMMRYVAEGSVGDCNVGDCS